MAAPSGWELAAVGCAPPPVPKPLWNGEIWLDARAAARFRMRARYCSDLEESNESCTAELPCLGLVFDARESTTKVRVGNGEAVAGSVEEEERATQNSDCEAALDGNDRRSGHRPRALLRKSLTSVLA
eukprot:3942030-Pleurochrysis_carterae.AAC.1